jgi:hypothetical protein
MICPCCEIEHDSLRVSPWISKPVCSDCFFVWYEGASMKGGAELVRSESRKRQGATVNREGEHE